MSYDFDLFIFLNCFAFSSVSGINSCPPNPGSTLIINTKSILLRYGNSDDISVFGLIDIPTLYPSDLILLIVLLSMID